MERSFGIIPFRKNGEKWELFLIKNRNGNYWGFPKGHADSHEVSQKATAERELYEETNLLVERYFSDKMVVENYQYTLEDKVVDKESAYYLAEVSGEVILQEKEIVEGKWLSFEAALKTATYPATQKLFPQIKALFKEGNL